MPFSDNHSRSRRLFCNLERILIIALFAAGFHNKTFGADTIQIPSSPQISNDGKTLYFSWSGDLWRSAIGGGEAQRLTHHPAPDENPRLSKNGKFLFFNSTRSGSKQVYRIPAIGGTPEQITFHSEGSTLEDLHPTKPIILVSGYRDHGGRTPYRLFEKPLDPSKDERILFDSSARNGRYSPNGKKILFVSNGIEPYRKGYEGSQAARLWIYDLSTKEFTEPVKNSTGCRFPMWAPGGKSFYYVTAQSGSFNIWRHTLGKDQSKQITTHTDDNILTPALSPDGSFLVYRHLFDFYQTSSQPGAQPTKIKLHHRTTLEHPSSEALLIKSTSDATVTASGLEWAFVAEGEIWGMDTILKEPINLTNSPAHESDIYFSDDGQHLYYLKDNGIDANYWRLSKTKPDHYWWESSKLNHEPVTKGPLSKAKFSFSPDQQLIAYLEYPGSLWIAKPDGSESRKLIEHSSFPDYSWSPDGKYITYAVDDENFNSEIYIIATDAKSQPVNVSRHPDNDFYPRWSPDGKTLTFFGRRHSSATDLFFVHLTRETHFESERDRLLDSAKKAMEQDPAYQKTDPPEEKEKAADDENPKKQQPQEAKEQEEKQKEEPNEKASKLDLEDIHLRIQRIPLNGLPFGQPHWSPDSKHLFFLSGNALYKVEPKAGAKPTLAHQTGGTIVRFDQADTIYTVSSGIPTRILKGQVTTYPFSVPFSRDRTNHQRMGFRQAWRTMRDYFYDPALNNRDWDQIREKYELAAANSTDRDNYRRVMYMMLGELNGSHLGFYPKEFPKQWKFDDAWQQTTPHLGVRLDRTRTVTFVHPNGPADQPKSRLFVGDRLIEIDGKALRNNVSITRLLNGRLDRDIILKVKNQKNKKRLVTIRPINHSQARLLATSADLDERRVKVESLSKGKLGYLHVARMMWNEFEKFEQHIYERGAGKEGLIIDVRDNGGGFTADHLLTVLTQPKHSFTIPRNGKTGFPQDRLVYASWNKPIVVLCNENSFSNAEIFSHAIKTLNRGKLVGKTTAGGVISTGAKNILDLGQMRLPFRGWFLLNNGKDMELNGATPHFSIDITPNDNTNNRDPQLDKAIEVLTKEVAAQRGKLPKPIYRSK